MVGTDFPSPRAIPPRHSSISISSTPSTVIHYAGGVGGGGGSSAHGPSSSVSSSQHGRQSSKPLNEGSWISQGGSSGGGKKMSGKAAAVAATRHSRNASLGTAESPATWTNAKEKILRGPYEYLVNQPGKSIRKQFILAFNEWLEVPPESVEIINRVVDMLHTASLLVDDVEDNSELRRGIPVTHAIYGVAQTLNSANYMYFVALQELVKLNNPTALHIYTEEMCNLHRGQGMDLFWRDTLTTPTEEDYFEMVGNKTGGLFRLAIKLMQAESTSTKVVDCVGLVGLMGVLFQIRDDYMNLWSSDYSQNKGMCEDLTEGKFSFPVIHSIRANPASLVLINILKQKTKDETVKRYAVGYMDQTGSFAYTRKVLHELFERARLMIHDLDAGAGKAGPLLDILNRMSVE